MEFLRWLGGLALHYVMDPIAIVFYAVICGLLSLFAPQFGGLAPRLAVGAAVGAQEGVRLAPVGARRPTAGIWGKG